jgi:hypothetical protein
MNPLKYFNPKYWARKYFAIRPAGAVAPKGHLPESPFTGATRAGAICRAVLVTSRAVQAIRRAEQVIDSVVLGSARAGGIHWATLAIRRSAAHSLATAEIPGLMLVGAERTRFRSADLYCARGAVPILARIAES